jgi:signal transduction histidine kinase
MAERRTSQNLRLLLPLLAAAGGALAAEVWTAVDSSLVRLITVHPQPAAQAWQNLLILIPISYLVFESGLRAGHKYLIFALIQSMAVAILICFLTSKYCNMAGSVLGPLVAALVAIGLSLTLRRLYQIEAQLMARFYELSLKNRELSETKLALLKQDEAERRLLASDLHDQVLADLRAVSERTRGLNADSIQIREIDQIIARACANIREVMENLSPSVLENLGLKAALDQLVRTAATGKLQGRFLDQIDEELLNSVSRSEQLLIFRLAQEAVNNVVKHAQAQKVLITLAGSCETMILTLTIRDDGIGLPATTNLQDDAPRPIGESRGMRYMKLKAALIGATLNWSSPVESTSTSQGGGTEVKLQFNLKERR